MLVILAVFLFFSLAVRHKWRNAAAKKDEILRLVAVTSEEEAGIVNLQAVEEFNYFQEQRTLLENVYYCAVCSSPTTTRCSRCKAVRYCSGKCQIIHWRQGHKDVCRPTVVFHAGNESEFVIETASKAQFETHLNDDTKVCSDSLQEHDDTGSSSSSLPYFSSSTEHSETSFDTSVSEFMVSETPIRSDTVFVNKSIEANKIKKTLATKTDEDLKPKGFEDSIAGNGDFGTKEFVPSTAEMKRAWSSRPLRTFVSADDQKNLAQPSSNEALRPFSFRDNHQVPNTGLKCSQCSKPLTTPSSDEYWNNESQLCNAKETRSMPCGALGNYQKISTKPGSPDSLPFKVENVKLSQPSSRSLKTSVRKFVQHFRAAKHSKSYSFAMQDTVGNENDMILFHPKIFSQLYSADVELHPFGLVNCGNSCYASAVLQCLTFTRPITLYLLQGFHSKTCHLRDWCFICEFELLVRKGKEMNSPLSPVGILSRIHRIGSNLSRGREEDAHEFLRNVVDTMQSICLRGAGVSDSLSGDLTLLGLTFGGYLQSKIKCMKCSGRFEQYDRMLDLTVEVDGDIDTLEEALRQFTSSETLNGDDKYKCSRCKSYQKAKKKLTVLEAPNILTIVLKRFRSGNLDKLSKLVQFPEVLNLAPYMSGLGDKYPIYHLYAVIVHLNTKSAAYSGHYISYIKDFRGDWFRIDDSMVTPVHLENVLSVEAYILFYARHTPRGPSLLVNSSMYSDGKTKRNMEAISSSNGSKKKNSKTKPSSSIRSAESTIAHQSSERPHFWMSPDNFSENHSTILDRWAHHSKLRNPILDSSSDSSSIFSASDAGSYSTDSTKDSSAEDISGYIFGSNWYH